MTGPRSIGSTNHPHIADNSSVSSSHTAKTTPVFRRASDPQPRTSGTTYSSVVSQNPVFSKLADKAQVLSQKVQSIRQEHAAARAQGADVQTVLKTYIGSISRLTENMNDLLSSLLKEGIALGDKLPEWQALVDGFNDAVKEAKRYVEDLFTSLLRKTEDALTEEDDPLALSNLTKRGDRLCDDVQQKCSRLFEDSSGKLGKLIR